MPRSVLRRRRPPPHKKTIRAGRNALWRGEGIRLPQVCRGCGAAQALSESLRAEVRSDSITRARRNPRGGWRPRVATQRLPPKRCSPLGYPRSPAMSYSLAMAPSVGRGGVVFAHVKCFECRPLVASLKYVQPKGQRFFLSQSSRPLDVNSRTKHVDVEGRQGTDGAPPNTRRPVRD